RIWRSDRAPRLSRPRRDFVNPTRRFSKELFDPLRSRRIIAPRVANHEWLGLSMTVQETFGLTQSGAVRPAARRRWSSKRTRERRAGSTRKPPDPLAIRAPAAGAPRARPP